MQYNHHRSHACTLLCTALALAFGCAAAHAADVKISGSVITGLYFNKVEGVDNGNLKMGGAGELPDDPHLMLTAREDLGNGWYTGAQLQNRFYPDSGTFRSNGYLFDAQSRLFVGNDQIEFSFGRIAGLTVAGRPYSVYGKTNANMTFASLGGIAPANIMFQPGDLSNAIAFSTNAQSGLFVRGVYSNGDSVNGTDTETTDDWSDRRHVAQFSTGWTGDHLKTAVVYSFEMPGNVKNADGTRPEALRKKNTHAVHLIASYDFGGPAVSGILYASQNEWRIGPVGDLSRIVGGNAVVSNSEEGLDNLAVFMSAKYPIGQHTISGSVGFLKSKWKGAETSVGHDEGTMTMAGLVYYYNFSKRTNFYGAASWSDGKKLLDGVDRFNQVLTAVGLMHRF